MAEKIQRAIEGYKISKKGYKPTNGNLAASIPPKGGSGMEPAPPPKESGGNSGDASSSSQSQSNSDE